MQSPFTTHRATVLGHYSTAAWLRGVVMALWNGTDHPVRLDRVSGTDDDHFKVFSEMVGHYRLHGENDPAFVQLVKEVETRRQEEREAYERSVRFEAWCADVETELRRLKKPVDLVSDRYSWLEKRFDAGDNPANAAATCELIQDQQD